MRLQNKTALVTGGSRGIGRACVGALAAEGAKVAFVYQSNQAAAEELVRDLKAAGHSVQAIQADVKDYGRAEQLVEQLLGEWEHLDILVNSAGVIRDGLFAMMSPKDWSEVIDTNLNGTYNYCHAVTKPMMSQRRGSIVNISSVAAQYASRGQVNYAASKGGIDGLTRSSGQGTGRPQDSRERRGAGHDRNRHERSGPQPGGRSNQRNHSVETCGATRGNRPRGGFSGQRRCQLSDRSGGTRRWRVEPGWILSDGVYVIARIRDLLVVEMPMAGHGCRLSCNCCWRACADKRLVW